MRGSGASASPGEDALWIDEAAALDGLCERLSRAPRLSIDTEANGFHAYRPELCLIQAAWEEDDRVATALVDPLALAGGLRPLRELLEGAAQEKILHGADYDVRLMKRDAAIAPRRLFDTEIAARLLGYERTGLSHLAERFGGVRLSKAGQRTDWARRPLPAPARRYAADDARVLFAIRDEVGRALERAERGTWADEEFQRLEAVEPDRSGPPDARAVVHAAPRAGSLDPGQRAVLFSLVEWRETVARRMDRPPGFVVPIRALVDIARRCPASREDLERASLARPLVDRHGRQILSAVAKGRASAPMPRPPGSPGAARRVDRKTAATLARLKDRRNAKAASLRLDPGVLCAGEALRAVARDRPTDEDGLVRSGLRRWQARVVGPDLLTALGA